MAIRLPLSVWLGLLGLLLAGMRPGVAQSVYTVNDVPVEVTAADAVAAREQAIAVAQQEGLRRLVAQLAPDTPAEQLPDIAKVPVDRYVRSFEIANEQVGARSDIGRLNVTYAGDRVRDLLRRSGITPPPPPVPTLIIPAVQEGDAIGLWWAADPWRAALGRAVEASDTPSLILPLGDVMDVAEVTPATLAANDVAAVESVTGRYGAKRAVLVTLTPGSDTSQQTVTLRGLRQDQFIPDAVPVELSGGDGSLDAAAAAAVAAIKRARLTPRGPAGPVQTALIAIPLSDLSGWLKARRDLDETAEVRSWRLDSFARRQAEVTVRYVGEFPALQESLAKQGWTLLQEGGRWLLQAGVAAPPAL